MSGGAAAESIKASLGVRFEFLLDEEGALPSLDVTRPSASSSNESNTVGGTGPA